MTVEKDAEEIFNIFYFEQNSSILDHEPQDVDKLQMIFMPPNDDLDSHKDDAPGGAEEGTASIKNIGRGVLSQVAEVRAIVEHGKRDVSIDSSQLEPTTSTTKRHKLIKKKQKWTTKKLNPSRPAYKCSNSTKEPNIIQSIRHNNLKPIDIFKLCFDDDTMKLICIESIKYVAQKGDSQFTLSVDDL